MLTVSEECCITFCMKLTKYRFFESYCRKFVSHFIYTGDKWFYIFLW